jgi:hypothetical protein
MNAVFDIAVTLGMLGFLVVAVVLTKRVSNAAASIFSGRHPVRRGPENVGRQVKRDEAFRPSTHHLTRT